jgi:hypothetical protein
LGLFLKLQGRYKEGFKCGEIGQALILFKACDLRFAVTDSNGELKRRYLSRSPKVLNEFIWLVSNDSSITYHLHIFTDL